MTTEELRHKLIQRIDALLGRSLLVWGEDRALLAALRGYVAVMAETELQRVLGFFSYGEGDETMARKKMGKAELTKLAQQVGLDLGKFDLNKILQLIAILLQFLQQPAQKAAKQVKCDPEQTDVYCACHEAALLALESAKVSLECCSDCTDVDVDDEEDTEE